MMDHRCCVIVLFILYFTVNSSAKKQSSALTSYQQRIEEMRSLVNKPRSPLKTKRYKCIEIDDTDDHLNAYDRLWPANDGLPKQSQVMLQMHEHADGSSSLSGSTMPSQLGPPQWQRITNTSPKQPVVLELSKMESATMRNRPLEPASSYSLTSRMPHAHAVPQSQTASQQLSISRQYQSLPAAQNARQRSSGKPSLILSPQHCAQIKHYANMYAVRDVNKWVSQNCPFAKMYLPSATCEEINVLVASCNL